MYAMYDGDFYIESHVTDILRSGKQVYIAATGAGSGIQDKLWQMLLKVKLYKCAINQEKLLVDLHAWMPLSKYNPNQKQTKRSSLFDL